MARKNLTSYLLTTVSLWLRDATRPTAPLDPELSNVVLPKDTSTNAVPGAPEESEVDDEPLNVEPIDRRYVPVKLLGQGGFGRVFLARDEMMDGQEVALKVIHRRYCGTAEIEQRFRREIRAMRNIAHDGVPQIYNDGKTEIGELYFTMRFVPGRNLCDLIAAEAPLKEVRVIRFAIQIAEALSYAHSRGLVHRDLKPPNVQVTALENGEEKISLLDFGIASSLQGHPGTGIDLTSSLIGTPVYMAPERMRGKTATAAVDLYALGLVIYEMLSGKAPFFGATPAEVFASKMRDTRPPLADFDSSPELARLVRELIVNEPEKRPSAVETVARLKALIAGPPAKRSRAKPLLFVGKWVSL